MPFVHKDSFEGQGRQETDRNSQKEPQVQWAVEYLAVCQSLSIRA